MSSLNAKLGSLLRELASSPAGWAEGGTLGAARIALFAKSFRLFTAACEARGADAPPPPRAALDQL